MKQRHADYQVVPYPKIRRFMAAEFRSSHHMPMIHGLLEVDVTRAREFLRGHGRQRAGPARRSGDRGEGGHHHANRSQGAVTG